jgi:hypothetical protein
VYKNCDFAPTETNYILQTGRGAMYT